MRTCQKTLIGLFFFFIATMISLSFSTPNGAQTQPSVAVANVTEPTSSAPFLYNDRTGTFDAHGIDLQITALGNAVTVLTEHANLRVHFVNSNPAIRPVGREVLPAVANLYLGSDPARWQEGLPLYNAILYENLYDGVDLAYTVAGNHLKSEFVLQPGVSPEVITLRYEGDVTLATGDEGELEILTADGGVHREVIPAAYQIIDGRQVAVDMAYRLIDDRSYTFVAQSALSPTAPLIIDPILIQATYFGEDMRDEGWAIAYDSEGSTLVTGITWSYPEQQSGRQDVFVTKLNAAGDLEFVTLIGGRESEEGNGIDVDGFNNIYVAGETWSPDFPTRNAFQPRPVVLEDAFVLKLTPEGTLVYSTYLGGSDSDEINDITVDAAGNTYVGGEVYSDDFPLLNPLDMDTYGEKEEDAFISIFDPDGHLLYSTYISAIKRDQVFRLTVDDQGYIYATGMTSSPSFPTTHAAQPRYGGGWEDCFVLKLDPWNNELIYSTFLGGEDRDACWGIDVDQEGNVYVAGYTTSFSFPTQNALQSEFARGGKDITIAKYNAAGEIVYSTYWGGSGRDEANDLALDSGGNLYIVGTTSSTDLSLHNAMEPVYGGGEFDGVLLQLNPDGSVGYASYVGGSGDDRLMGVRIDEDWVVHVTGLTSSRDMTTRRPVDSVYSGMIDAYIARYGIVPTPTPTPTPTPFASRSIGPEGGLLWLEYPDHLTLLTVPRGAVSGMTVFTLTYDNRPNAQGDLFGVDHFFRLEAQEMGITLPITSFPIPLELTLGYNNVSPLITTTVNLYRLQNDSWTTSNVTLTMRGHHYLDTQIDDAGSYGILGRTNPCFLPLILHSAP